MAGLYVELPSRSPRVPGSIQPVPVFAMVPDPVLRRYGSFLSSRLSKPGGRGARSGGAKPAPQEKQALIHATRKIQYFVMKNNLSITQRFR